MTLNSGAGGNAVVYVVSATKFVVVPLNDSNPAVWVFDPPSSAGRVAGLGKGKHKGKGSGGGTRKIDALAPARGDFLATWLEPGGTRGKRPAAETAP